MRRVAHYCDNRQFLEETTLFLLFVHLRGAEIKEAAKAMWVRKSSSYPDPLSMALAVP